MRLDQKGLEAENRELRSLLKRTLPHLRFALHDAENYENEPEIKKIKGLITRISKTALSA